MTKLLDLRFAPGSLTGFTPRGIAGFGDLRPAAVVRELIQNSLDATAEAGETSAIVRFRLTQVRTDDIPGIRSYKKAFFEAVQSNKRSNNGTLPSQAARVVQVIREALDRDKQDVLSVLDNGIGLNEARLTALLSDGMSVKSDTATGTFGNGHSVVIPASDFRYVLYGGVTKEEERIGAGHAVLASRIVEKKKHPLAGDGFLVHGFRNGTYEYARGSSLPDFIAKELEDIQENSGVGTAVIVPGFNNFREDTESLWQMVARAAACNFFQAIYEDQLQVWVEDIRPGEPGGSNSLDCSTLREVLEANREEKRAQSFLSGNKAFEAHEVLESGGSHSVNTKLGKIGVKLLLRSGGSRRVDLCRNGMWITDDKNIPGFYYTFQDRSPFHAVLLLDSTTGARLYDLVRNAEGPLHDKLDVGKRLSSADARALRAAFGELRDWLKDNVPEVGGDSYNPDDFLVLDFGEEGKGDGGSAHRSFWGIPTAVPQGHHSPSRYDDPDPDPPPGPGPGPRPRPRPGPPDRAPPRPMLRPILHGVSIPNGPNRRRIQLECQKSCENAELRLSLDENVDATCDLVRRDEFVEVFLSDVSVNGRDIGGKELVRKNGRVVGVRLGDIAEGTSVRVDCSYELSQGLSIARGHEPALRVEVFRAPSKKSLEA